MSGGTEASDASRALDGLKVLVLTSGHEALDARVYGREAQSVADMGASVTVVGKLTRGRLSRFLLQPWRCVWRARRLRPDIVHFHDAEMLVTMPVTRVLWPRAKFVYDVHEDFANLMLIRDWLPSALKPAVRALTDGCERALAGLVHGIVAVTPPLAEKFPHRHKVAARNFPTPEFHAAAQAASRPAADREYDLVHLGTLSRRRAEYLVRVVEELERRRPGARTLVLGATPDVLAFLRERMPRGVDVVGAVAHAEVPRHLGNAKVGIDVHPWEQPHLAPALAVKVGEYLACGCAVVASSMPVLERVLDAGGARPTGILTIRGGEPADYAEAVRRLVEEIDGGRDRGDELRRFAADHLNWRNEALEISRLYRALVGDRPCAA